MSTTKILFINSCISNHNPSRTECLSREVLKKLENSETSTVEEVDVQKNAIKPLDLGSLQVRDQLVGSKDFENEMFDLAKQFVQADKIVIGAPYWDLSFPAQLKAYIENVMVTDITFTYTESGVVGLCNAKELIYVTTAGGYIEDNNFGYDYIKAVAKMMGIEKTSCITAEGLDIQGNNPEQILSQAIQQI